MLTAGLCDPENADRDENRGCEMSSSRNSLGETKDFLLLLQRLGNLFSKHSLSSPPGRDVAKSQLVVWRGPFPRALTPGHPVGPTGTLKDVCVHHLHQAQWPNTVGSQ